MEFNNPLIVLLVTEFFRVFILFFFYAKEYKQEIESKDR